MRIDRWTWIPLVAALSVAAACSSTQEQGTADTEGGIVEETGEAAGAVGEGVQDVADRAENALDDEVTIMLSPVSGSGVSGDADFRASGASTRVEVELSGLTAGGTYMPEIQNGSCAQSEGPVVALEPVVASGMEAGSTSTIDPSVLIPSDQGHHVAVSDETGMVVACGELPIGEAQDIQ
ncbi:MAG: hypothetical protein ACREK7_03165 [Gemmatimonadota bacterium]